MNVRIKKLTPGAVIPTKAHPADAGFDLTATSVEYVGEHDCWVYGTGLAMEIPDGHVGLIFPRSSNRKTDVYLANHVAVIDSCYRGEIKLCFKYRDKDNPKLPPYEVGARMAQLMIMPYPEITFEETGELSDTDRGNGGFGSTGK